MEYRKLGNTDIKVSKLCLGTMTWGEQNTQSDAFKQMDFAIANGINFFDTAELYAIPPRAETAGATEKIIGNWLQKTKQRENIILASKITGPAQWMTHIRNGETAFNAATLSNAIEGSLKRLQTDYIDLYQLHWPERNTNFFGQLGYVHKEKSVTSIHETLEALSKLIDAGKIRYVGLSNETPWGVSQFLKYAEQYNLPRIVSIQNPYSLLNRTYEIGLAEISIREQCGLLAYSPLGFGVLSGKYLNNQKPANSRITLWPNYSRYSNPQAVLATEKYAALANALSIPASQLALAFINSRPFLTSTIIGATTLEQLKENLGSIEIKLSESTLNAIEDIHREIANPSP